MRVKLLQWWVLEWTEIKVVDRQIVDQKTGYWYQLLRNLHRFAYSLVSYKVNDIICIRQYDHVKPRRGLIMCFFIILLLLRKKGCEWHFLVVSWDNLHDTDQVSLGEFVDKWITELGGACYVVFVWVQKVGGSQIMVWFNELFGLETDQCHTWCFNVFYLIHVLLWEFNFLASEWIISAYLCLKHRFSLTIKFFCDSLKISVCPSVDFFWSGSLCLGIKSIKLYTDLSIVANLHK